MKTNKYDEHLTNKCVREDTLDDNVVAIWNSQDVSDRVLAILRRQYECGDAGRVTGGVRHQALVAAMARRALGLYAKQDGDEQ